MNTMIRLKANNQPATGDVETLDDIAVSAGLDGSPMQLQQVTAAYGVLRPKLEGAVRRKCESSILSGDAPSHHRSDRIFDEAIKDVSSDITNSFLNGRRNEASVMFSGAAVFVFSTEAEIRKHVIGGNSQVR